MYYQAFGFREEPFGVTPDPRFIYSSESYREALASLLHGIEAGRGFMSLIAEPGMGKTTLLNDLLERTRSSARSALLFQTLCTRHELLRYLLVDAGLSPSDSDEDIVTLHEQFNQLLLDTSRAGKKFIVIIDEAHNLSDEVLESVRLMSDFETRQAKLLQIILAGQPQLGVRLADPKHWQLRQRMSMMCQLRTLSEPEVFEYIQYRSCVAGRADPPFDVGAIEAIARHSRGVPRIINNYCFNLLSLAYALGQEQAGEDLVEEVASDLTVYDKPKEHGWETLRVSEHAVLDREKTLETRHHFVDLKIDLEKERPKPAPAISTQARGSQVTGAALSATGPFPGAVAPKLQPEECAQLFSERADPPVNRTSDPGPQLVRSKSGPGSIAVARIGPANLTNETNSGPRAKFRVSCWIGSRQATIAIIGVGGILLLVAMHLSLQPKGPFVETAKLNITEAQAAQNSGAERPTADASALLELSRLGKPQRTDSAIDSEVRLKARTGSESGTSKTQIQEQEPALLIANGSTNRELDFADEAPPRIESASSAAAPSLPVGPATLPRMGFEPAHAGDEAVVPGQLIRKVMPVYPPTPGNIRLEGAVDLTASISEEGSVEHVQVENGNSFLASAAVDAVKQWRYTPFTLNGKPIKATTKITIHFRR